MPSPVILFAFGILTASLLIPGCSGEPDAATLGPSMEIVPLTSVGKIRPGMKVSDVVSAYGEPQRRTVNALSYPKLGFAAMHDTDGNVLVIMCGDVTGLGGPFVKAFTGRTTKGIGMGSRREEVVAAYGEPDQADKNGAVREMLKYGRLGMHFSLYQGRVHHIMVRLTPQEEPDNSIRVTPAPSQQ